MEYCEHCGAKVMKYWHRLNKPLCAAMIKIYQKHGTQSVKISDLLTHNQVCNFQKLKYWHFVEKNTKEDLAMKGGYWNLTDKAEAFIKGKLRVPFRVQTFRGDVIEKDFREVRISDVIEGYQYRLDYLKEAE